jgi:hypothetical protein
LTIAEEVTLFDEQCMLLADFISQLASIEVREQSKKDFFLAEAVMFRLYRVYERLVRAAFLDFCVQPKTLSGQTVNSKLKCSDWDTAEAILKAGNKFLEWGSVELVKGMSFLVFERGFPISDLLSPIHSDLVDLQRLRNFIAHDSAEAKKGFKKVRAQYVRVGDPEPESVGELALYRKSPRADMTLKIVHRKVSGLSSILSAL